MKIKKIFLRKIFKIKVSIKSVWLYCAYTFKVVPKRSNSKSVYFNVNNPEVYHRYFYTLCKYFLIERYQVYIKKDLTLIYYLSSDVDSSFLFEEQNIFLGKPKSGNYIEFNDQNISPDYFCFLQNNRSSINEYYIPLGQHPYAYLKGYWNEKVDLTGERKKALFFAGNFSKQNYNRSENFKLFNVNNRLEIKNSLDLNENFHFLSTQKQLDDFLKDNLDHKIIFINRQGGNGVEPNRMRYYLSRFDFFFALPGSVMPLCHNIIEAMSAGCIPFLQTGYAKVMRPPLTDGEECISFENLDEIPGKINALFSLSQKEINSMREKVLDYHDKFLNPSGVVGELISGNFNIMYLNAEFHSVRLLEENL